jgi:hypothetical protein
MKQSTEESGMNRNSADYHFWPSLGKHDCVHSSFSCMCRLEILPTSTLLFPTDITIQGEDQRLVRGAVMPENQSEDSTRVWHIQISYI